MITEKPSRKTFVGRVGCANTHPVGVASDIVDGGRVGLLDWAVFFIPLVQLAEIRVVGRLFVSELILAALLPFLLARNGGLLRERLPRLFIWFGILWLFAQVGTDWARGAPFEDYSRGWAKITFTLVNFCALYLLLVGKSRRIVLFAAGWALGGVIAYFVNPGTYAAGSPWKFGYGVSITWLLVLGAVASAGRSRGGRRLFWPAALLFFAAALNIYLGFRSLGGVCVLAATYLMILGRSARGVEKTGRSQLRHTIIVASASLAGVWLAFSSYQYAAGAGLLGEDARLHYERQSAGEYGLLVGGRGEILVSWRAILDSPIIGHGSWAKDCRYADLLSELKRKAGYFEGGERDTCLIPTHSYIFGAWVEAGIVGALFWVWVLSLPLRVLQRLYHAPDRLAPLVVFFAAGFVWDIFFSPYGAVNRIVGPFYSVVMISYLRPKMGRRDSSVLPLRKAVASV